jgi:hypothetical protein
MELTITQNGALYALHHRATDRYPGARRKRATANKIIRTDELLPAISSVWYKLKLHV